MRVDCLGSGLSVQGLVFRAEASGLKVYFLELRVEGVGFICFGLKDQNAGCRAYPCAGARHSTPHPPTLLDGGWFRFIFATLIPLALSLFEGLGSKVV